VDIDMTLFYTFAKIMVMKDGKKVRELDNQEYNSYELKDGEDYDFHQFRDADFFRKTSIPIPQTVKRIKKMLAQIKSQDSGSKIVFLTARETFTSSPKEFAKTFADQGINIDGKTVMVEFAGNEWKKGEGIDDTKKRIIIRYISSGDYRRVRLIDDHKPNLKALKDIENQLPVSIEKKVIDKHNLDMTKEKLPPISFYALWIDGAGNLNKY